MNATIAELTRAASRIKREIAEAEYEPYVFARDDEWVETLRRIEQEQRGNRTSPLWKSFLAYEAARVAYETAVAQHGRWRGELALLRQQLQAIETEQDPDTIDYAAYGTAKLKADLLARRVTDPHSPLQDLKATMEQTNERWGSMWNTYLVLKTEEHRIVRADFVPSVPGYDMKAGEVRGIRERIAAFEAQRGA